MGVGGRASLSWNNFISLTFVLFDLARRAVSCGFLPLSDRLFFDGDECQKVHTPPESIFYFCFTINSLSACLFLGLWIWKIGWRSPLLNQYKTFLPIESPDQRCRFCKGFYISNILCTQKVDEFLISRNKINKYYPNDLSGDRLLKNKENSRYVWPPIDVDGPITDIPYVLTLFSVLFCYGYQGYQFLSYLISTYFEWF